MEIILIEDRLPRIGEEVWLYFGSREDPNCGRGYWTGAEFKRSADEADVTEPNVFGWRRTADDDPVEGNAR